MGPGKRESAKCGAALRRLRSNRERFSCAPAGGLGACHAARASRALARSDGVVEQAAKGRRGAGTQIHCLHGKDAIIEDILDWRPFDYVTQTALLPIPGAPKILMTYAFDERDDGGTHFEVRFAKPKPTDLPFLEQIWPNVQENFDAGLEILRSMLEERAEASPAVDEPSLPISRERFLTHAVHPH